jgi:hypothetical protein
MAPCGPLRTDDEKTLGRDVRIPRSALCARAPR